MGESIKSIFRYSSFFFFYQKHSRQSLLCSCLNHISLEETGITFSEQKSSVEVPKLAKFALGSKSKCARLQSLSLSTIPCSPGASAS